MRILLIAPQPFFQNRGTPIAVKLLVTALSDQGHEIDILTLPEGDDIDIENVAIFRVRKFAWIKDVPIGFSWKKVIFDFFIFFSMLRLLMKNRYDIIHAIEESAFLALIMKKIFGIKYIYDMDSSIPNQLIEKYPKVRLIYPILSRIEKAMIKNSDLTIAVCESLGEIARNSKESDKVSILEDVPLFNDPFVSKIFNLDEKLGITGPIVMYVGNLEPYQGIDLLLDSFELLLNDGRCADLIIIGGEPNDMAKYKEIAKLKKIDENVHFLGKKPVEDLPFYLAEADILVSPRIKGENTPMKIYSYMYSAKPIVATNLITHTQVLNGDNAMLAEPVPSDFAEGIRSLVKNTDLRRSIGERAALDVEENYSYSSFKRKLEKIYRRIEDETP